MRNEQWFKDQIDQHHGRLLRYTRKWVRDEVAREIVQEAYLRLWKQVVSDGVASLKDHVVPWLFCVCRNLALDRLKKEGSMREFSDDEGSDSEAGENPESQLGRRQQVSHLLTFMKDLNPNQQEVIRLKFQEDLSYKEISEITGHSISHVGVIIHGAMLVLRKKLGQVPGGAQ